MEIIFSPSKGSKDRNKITVVSWDLDSKVYGKMIEYSKHSLIRLLKSME